MGIEEGFTIEVFKLDAEVLIEIAEEGLSNVDKGYGLNENYNSIFRSFHSLRGGAGVFGLESLRTHMYKLELLLEAQKKINEMTKHQVDYFLQGLNAARKLLNGGKVEFEHIYPEHLNQKSKGITPPKIVESRFVNETIPLENKKGTAFVVDDEPDIADNLTFLLKSAGIEVSTFYDAKELFYALETTVPDVIISDIVMPDFNGLEMLDVIRTASIDIPVIFISGHITKDAMLEAYKHGAYGFIEKPYNNVKVLGICKNAIEKSKSLELLEKSINYIMYQFNNLDHYLKQAGEESVRVTLKNELQIILEQNRKLKNL